jgi:hypothetical protein
MVVVVEQLLLHSMEQHLLQTVALVEYIKALRVVQLQVELQPVVTQTLQVGLVEALPEIQVVEVVVQ